MTAPNAAANPAGASRLQSDALVRRVAGSLGGSAHWQNSTPYEESNKLPVLVGRIGFVISGLVHRLPKDAGTNRCRTKHADTNRCRTKISPGLLGRRRGGRQMLHHHHGQLAPLSCRHELV